MTGGAEGESFGIRNAEFGIRNYGLGARGKILRFAQDDRGAPSVSFADSSLREGATPSVSFADSSLGEGACGRMISAPTMDGTPLLILNY